MGPSSSFHDTLPDAVPEAERRPILLRAYAETEQKEPSTRGPITPQFVLVFDTETTPDESQRLRFGTYQLLQKGKLREKGLFYDKVTSAELETLKAEAPKHGCVEPFSLHDFVHKRFLPTAFKAGGLVVGFNLPFDLSRLAIRHAAARVSRSPRTPEEIEAGAPLKDADRSMVGGFTFQLSPFDDQPWLRIKHRNSRSAFFKFAKPAQQEAARSERRRGERVQFQRGNFLDVKTLAAALTSTSHSLKSLRESSRRQAQGRLHRLWPAHRPRVHRLRGQRHRDDAPVLRGARAPVPPTSSTHDASAGHYSEAESRQGVSEANGHSPMARGPEGLRPEHARRDHELIFRRSRRGPYPPNHRSGALLRLRLDVPDGLHVDGPLALRHRARRRRGGRDSRDAGLSRQRSAR